MALNLTSQPTSAADFKLTSCFRETKKTDLSSWTLRRRGNKIWKKKNLQDVIPWTRCLVIVIVKASANYILLVKFSWDNQIVLLKQPELCTLLLFFLLSGSLTHPHASTASSFGWHICFSLAREQLERARELVYCAVQINFRFTPLGIFFPHQNQLMHFLVPACRLTPEGLHCAQLTDSSHI